MNNRRLLWHASLLSLAKWISFHRKRIEPYISLFFIEKTLIFFYHILPFCIIASRKGISYTNKRYLNKLSHNSHFLWKKLMQIWYNYFAKKSLYTCQEYWILCSIYKSKRSIPNNKKSNFYLCTKSNQIIDYTST